MRTLHSFLHRVWGFLRGIPKKCYRTCAIITAGTIILSMVAFHSGSFAAAGKNKAITTGIAEADTSLEDGLEEESVTEAKAQVLIETPQDEETGSNTAAPQAAQVVPRSAADVVTQTAEEAAKSRKVIPLNGDDYENLLKIVEAEATGSDIKGKILVADVIINRVNHPRFPDTVTEVVFQKNGRTAQFSPTIDGRLAKVTVTESTIEAVNRALEGEDYSQGALFFSARSFADPTNMSWFDNNLQWLQAYGGHEFYTF